MKFYNRIVPLLFALAVGLLPRQARAQEPGLAPSRDIGIDIADVPLNRPTPDRKSYTYWTQQQKDAFFPSLLGLRSPSAQVIHTKYFNIYFTDAELTARQIADFADDILQDLMRHYPTFVKRIAPISVIVDDQADYLGNAYAVYNANYVHFWTNPIDWELRGTTDWVRNTFVHELTHVVTLKAAHKGWPFQIAIVNASRADENPDFNFTLGVYHLAVSAGFAEGIAQWEATKNGDEYWDSHRDMILRMATLNNSLLSLPDMGQLNGKTQFQGEQVYNQGYAMLNYIGARFGPEKVREIFEHKPIVNFNSSLKAATGISANQLYSDWVAHLNDYYGALADSIKKVGVREGEKLVDMGSLDYHPVYSPQGDKVAFITNDDSDYFITKLKVMDLTTKKVKKIADDVDNRFTWTADGDKIVYIKAAGPRWDIYTYDFKTDKETRTTVGLRGKDPSLSPDGKQVAFVTIKDGTSNLGLVNIDGTDVRMLTHNNDATQYYGPKWSPDGKTILFSIFRTGLDRDIAMINADTTPWPKKEGRRPLKPEPKPDSTKAFPDSLAFADNAGFKPIIHSRADERDPVWLPDGSGFVFSSDRTGIFNLYIHDLATGKEKQLTNVLGGAFVPSISPDGKDVVYAGYQSTNYNIYRIPLSDAVNVAPPDMLTRDYDSIYTGKKLADLYDVGRYSTHMVSYGLTPIMLLGPTFIGNRFGLDQISLGAEASWGNLLGDDLFYLGGLIGKNLKKQQDLNSEFSFYYENSLTPILSEHKTYVPRIFFGGSRQTINSLVDAGTVFAQQDTQSGTLVTTVNGQQVLIPNATQFLKLSVTEEDAYKDLFNDFTVGTEFTVGRRQNVGFAYGHRSYSENLHVKQVVYDSTRIFQTDPNTGQTQDITDQIPGVGGTSVFLDDDLYKNLTFFSSNEWTAGWSFFTFKPRTDTYINPSGGRAITFRYRRINATVTDSLAFSADLNGDNIPDPTATDASPTLLRSDNTQVSFNEYIGSWNEFVPLVGRSTLAMQGFVAYKDGAVKPVKQNGGPFEGVFYYPLRYYLGGLGTLRGYPYFATAGSKVAFGRASFTFPIVKHVGAELPPFFFDKIYGSLFFEAGGTSNAATFNDIKWNWGNVRHTFLADWGAEIRFQMFSHYRLPMFGYFIVAFPTKRNIPLRDDPTQTQRVDRSRIYFGLAL